MDASLKRLQDLSDPVLIEGLRPGLRDAIDRLLARGMSHRAVIDTVWSMAMRAGGGSGRGSLVVATVEAYLRSKS